MLSEEERSGLEKVIREVRPGLVRFARHLTRESCDADDLVQEAITRSLRQWTCVPPAGPYRAWLKVVLRHLFIDERRRRSHLTAASAPLEDIAAPEPEAPQEWWAYTVEEAERVATTLAPPFRETYELFVTGVPYGEIARRLDVPVGTVAGRISRAREKMKALLRIADPRSATPANGSAAAPLAGSHPADAQPPFCFPLSGPEPVPPSLVALSP